jgi:predicted phage terminase large subunit-like protein
MSSSSSEDWLSRLPLPTLEQIERELARRKAVASLAEFFRQGWHVLEPDTELVWNWHIDAVCEHLEAVAAGKIRRLVINIPPGHLKSLLCSVFFPAWQWLHRPGWRVLTCSYDMGLATRDSVRSRDLITSDWYQQTFAPEWSLKSDQNVKSYYENDRTGFRFCMATGSAATGYRGDCVVIDDPLNKRDKHSDAAIEESRRFVQEIVPTRLNDKKSDPIVLVMQRLHERDATGVMLRQGGWDHLCLPSEFVPDRKCSTSIGWSDPRTTDGELLFEGKFPADVLSEDKLNLGGAGFAGEHQQDPRPTGGGIFKEWWWCFWYPADVEPPPALIWKKPDGTLVEATQAPLPKAFDRISDSWDLAFKGASDNDRVAGQRWATVGANAYLIDRVCDTLDFVATVAAIRLFASRPPGAPEKLVEDKANGPAIMSMLHDEIPGLVPVEPKGGKLVRAHAVSPYVEAGNVWLPHPALFPWVHDYLDELGKFPRGQHDDEVDSTTQALSRLLGNEGTFPFA